MLLIHKWRVVVWRLSLWQQITQWCKHLLVSSNFNSCG